MTTNTKKKTPLSLFSLPDEIIISVLARVTRKSYPILSCVSKKLRSLLNSSELHKTRYLLGKHCFYVCLEERFSYTKHWFSLNENHLLEPILTPSLPEQYCSAATMVGPEIYFLCSFVHGMTMMMIFDPRSGKLRQGSPRRRVLNCFHASMGLVDEKIYVFGSREEKIKAQIFDLKTQIWQVAPTPTLSPMHPSLSLNHPNIALEIRGGPINTRNLSGASVMVYDPRDGKCEYIRIPANFDYANDVCVIDNVMYMYCFQDGLMWFNTKTKNWRMVHGNLHLGVYLTDFSMVEYNGKLMFLWNVKKYESNQLWCAMILPYVSGEEIHARLEWSKCILSDVKYKYKIKHCLSRMD